MKIKLPPEEEIGKFRKVTAHIREGGKIVVKSFTLTDSSKARVDRQYNHNDCARVSFTKFILKYGQSLDYCVIRYRSKQKSDTPIRQNAKAYAYDVDKLKADGYELRTRLYGHGYGIFDPQTDKRLGYYEARKYRKDLSNTYYSVVWDLRTGKLIPCDVSSVACTSWRDLVN